MKKLTQAKIKYEKDKIKYNFYVFDTETTKLEPMQKNFVFGVIYGYNYKKVIHTYQEFIEEFNFPRYDNKTIFAHNAEFDLLTIFGNIIKNIDNAAIFNGKFIMCKYKKITFADSLNIFPASAEKIGEMLDSKKHENKKVKEGGLTKKNLNQKDIEYCIQDCRIIFTALLKIFEEIGEIKLTIASLAMFQFRSKFLTEVLYFSDLVDEFYSSYYGGRTEAFFIGECNCDCYDINSLYPDIMKNIYFPDIKRLKKETFIDTKYLLFLLKSYEGLAKVTVKHKDTYFGYLPVKEKINGQIKLLFPVGEFTTTVNFNELRFAIESKVVEVLKVHYVVYGNPMSSPFVDFVDYNYKIKSESTDKLKTTIFKLILNSLYGKWGQRLKMTTTYYEELPFQFISELITNEKNYEVKLFNQERKDCYLITENEQAKNTFFSIPTFSSYITSAARIKLLKSLVANEKNIVTYCDTDSIILAGKFEGKLSNELGDFKKEKKKIIEVRGLKNYSYINTDTDETINVIKGISKRSKQSETNKKLYTIQKYYKTKQAIAQNKQAGQSYIMKKELKQVYDKRIVLEMGRTIPIRLPIRLPIKEKIKLNKFIYDPANYYEAILLYFVQGGKVKKSDIIHYVTGKSKEINLYKNIMSETGMSFDTFNEYLSNDLIVSDEPHNEFIYVLTKFYNKTMMKKELLRISSNDIIKTKKINYPVYYDIPF
jgi:hypothetical protein